MSQQRSDEELEELFLRLMHEEGGDRTRRVFTEASKKWWRLAGIQLINTNEAASIAKVRVESVRRWLSEGKLLPKDYEPFAPPTGGRTLRPLIDKQEFLEFLKNKRGAGRPKQGRDE